MASKYAQFQQALRETISGTISFSISLLKYMVQYFMFLLLCGLAAKYGGPKGMRWDGKTDEGGALGSILSFSSQDSLEARPYWDQSQVPWNTYDVSSPLVGK